MNHIRYRWNYKTGSFVLTQGELLEARKLFFPSIDGEWLLKAAALPGKALAVACVIQLEAAFKKTRTISLGNGWLIKAGVDRAAKRRSLQALESAELVWVRRSDGKNPEVTIRGVR